MADEVKNGLSADPSRIASQWNRSTVADGSWLQKYTLSPLTARDYYLASAIDALGSATDDTTSALSAAISSVSSIHDEYINYLSATISGDISGYIDYVSGSVTALSSEFKTSATTISSKLDTEIQRATEVEEVLQSQINLINASTDVINVYGSYGGVNGFSVESAYYFDPAKTATYHLTNNDIIKIINDEYTPVEETGQTTTGHQTYYQWINNEGITGDPQSPSDGSWNFIGYTEPYYNIAEVNNKFTDISSTISNNYLSASTEAVKEGHNINVTKKTGPVIEIATKDNVDFTELSADTAWVDTISADVSAFDFYETTSGKRLSETQQGLLINTTASPFDPTKSASEGDVFWPANFEQIFSAWYDTDKLINIKYTNDFNDYITRLYTLHNVRQYTENNVTFYDLNFISNDDKVAYTAYAKVKRNGGEGGGAPSAPVLYACDEGPIDVEYTGENGIYVSGDHKIGLSSTYETALKEGSAASAYITLHSGDFLNSAQSAYNKLTFKYGTTTKDYQANSSAYSFTFNAGDNINFTTGTNQITISSNDTTYQGSTYISTANNIISVTGNLINSAQSGQSAYNWITTKSATLQAGQGITFYSAGPNILGISAEGTTYQASSYISTADKKISVTGTLITSAEAGSAASAWVNTNNTKLAYTANFNGTSNVITGYGTSSFAGGISSISVRGSVFTGRNVNLYDSNNIDFITANNSLTIDLNKNITIGENAATQIYLITETEDEEQKSSIVINDTYQSQLQLFNNKITRNSKQTTWDNVISASNGNFVSAYNQPITIATATTLPAPASMVNGVYYIV